MASPKVAWALEDLGADCTCNTPPHLQSFLCCKEATHDN